MTDGRINLVNDVLPIGLIEEIKSIPYKRDTCRTNLSGWQAGVVDFSGPIILHDVEGATYKEVKYALIEHIGEEFINKKWYMAYTLGTRFSYIPWHRDASYKRSMTVYLNKVWDENFSGYLLVKQNNIIRAIKPEFNTGVVFFPPVEHCTVMPNINAPLRESLQIFVHNEDEDTI